MTLNTRKTLAVQILPPGGANPLTMGIRMNRRILVGSAIGLVIGALIADGGTPTYAYSLTAGTLPTNVSLTAAGKFVVTGALVGGEKAIFQAAVQDSSGPPIVFQATFEIDIQHVLQPVAVTPTPIENAFSLAYSYTFAVSGATGTLSWAIASGTPPPVTVLNPVTGEMTISPFAVTGTTYNFIVTATDSGSGDVLPIPVSMYMAPAIQMVSPLPATLVVGQYYPAIPIATAAQPYWPPAANFGIPPYKYAYTVFSGPTPDWMIFNKAGDGMISGTPDVATLPSTPIVMRIQAIDSLGVGATMFITLNVVEPNQKVQIKRNSSNVSNPGPNAMNFNGIGAASVTSDGNTAAITLGASMNSPNVSCTIPANSTAFIYGTLTLASGVFLTREAGAFLVVM